MHGAKRIQGRTNFHDSMDLSVFMQLLQGNRMKIWNISISHNSTPIGPTISHYEHRASEAKDKSSCWYNGGDILFLPVTASHLLSQLHIVSKLIMKTRIISGSLQKDVLIIEQDHMQAAR
jgi:hypothetical protein